MVHGSGALILGIVLFFFDRISKWYAFYVGSAQIDSIVFFVFSNSFAFSLILSVLLVVVTVLSLKNKTIQSSSYGLYSLALILAGGFGNIIDRFVFGGVINPFSLGGLFYNGADIALLVGGIALIFLCFQKSTRVH